MSFSLRITNGDLDASTNVLGVVFGVEKLTQDLSLWLRERFGLDRFHPNYGSTLDNYIGNVIDNISQHELEVETTRVLSLYQQIQYVALQRDPGKYSLDELLNKVDEIKCQLSYDTVNINVKFTTAQGTPGVVNQIVGI